MNLDADYSHGDVLLFYVAELLVELLGLRVEVAGDAFFPKHQRDFCVMP